MQYYLAQNGKQSGPYLPEDLKSIPLRPDMLVWRQGLEAWVKAGELPELSDIIAEIPPSLPTEETSPSENLASGSGIPKNILPIYPPPKNYQAGAIVLIIASTVLGFNAPALALAIVSFSIGNKARTMARVPGVDRLLLEDNARSARLWLYIGWGLFLGGAFFIFYSKVFSNFSCVEILHWPWWFRPLYL